MSGDKYLHTSSNEYIYIYIYIYIYTYIYIYYIYILSSTTTGNIFVTRSIILIISWLFLINWIHWNLFIDNLVGTLRVKQCELIPLSLPSKCANHIHSHWDYTEIMNKFWCPLVADWLERNNMDCIFRVRKIKSNRNDRTFPSIVERLTVLIWGHPCVTLRPSRQSKLM